MAYSNIARGNKLEAINEPKKEQYTSDEDLKRLEDIFLEDCVARSPTLEDSKFNFACALLRTADIDLRRKGASLLDELHEGDRKNRDYQYYTALAYHSLNEHKRALDLANSLITAEPNNEQFSQLKEIILDKIAITVQKYMVYLDGSRGSERAFNKAIDMMRPDDELCLLSVIETSDPLLDKGFVGYDSMVLEHKEEYIERAHRRYTDICEARGIYYYSVGETGNPKDVICKVCSEEEIDLLLLPNDSDTLGVFSRMFGSSLSEYCIRNAKCSVLVVKKSRKKIKRLPKPREKIKVKASHPISSENGAAKEKAAVPPTQPAPALPTVPITSVEATTSSASSEGAGAPTTSNIRKQSAFHSFMKNGPKLLKFSASSSQHVLSRLVVIKPKTKTTAIPSNSIVSKDLAEIDGSCSEESLNMSTAPQPKAQPSQPQIHEISRGSSNPEITKNSNLHNQRSSGPHLLEKSDSRFSGPPSFQNQLHDDMHKRSSVPVPVVSGSPNSGSVTMLSTSAHVGSRSESPPSTAPVNKILQQIPTKHSKAQEDKEHRNRQLLFSHNESESAAIDALHLPRHSERDTYEFVDLEL